MFLRRKINRHLAHARSGGGTGGGRMGVRLALSCLLLSGCTSPRIERTLSDIPIGTAYEPTNLYAVDIMPADMRRVAVLPVFLGGESEAQADIVNALALTQLRQTGRFEVLAISREKLFELTGQSEFSSQEPFPPRLLAYLRDELSVSGILQTDLTHYRPYRPMVVGLRARLFGTGTGKPIWVVDEVFDAGSDKVDVAARRYSLEKAHQRYPYSDSYAALRGPSHFTTFALHTLYHTLPPLVVD